MSAPALPVSRVLKHLIVMCSVAAVLGVVVAGLAIPFAGIIGLGARNTAKTMDKLPADFAVGQLAQTSKILDAKGNLITTLYDQNRVYRPLNQISPKMLKAQVAIEDYRFYQHGALDVKGTLRAFVTNEANDGKVQGGSSITQQLVKMTLIYQARGNKKLQKEATEDSYSRKLRELRYAIALEQTHSKDWILEHYLNAAYYGDGAYGIQAAAKHYFDVNADQLTWLQSATLAGLVKNPTGYDPTNYPDAAIARRNTVLDRMAQLHVIPQAQADQLKKKKLHLNVQSSRNGCVNSTSPFYCQYVLNYLYKDKDLGATTKDRKQLLLTGGLTIKTSLQPDYQQAADDAAKSHVYATDEAIGAIAEVQPGTGDVLALAQSRPMGADKKKGQTYLEYAVPKEYGNAPGFQAGSTFKAFTMAAAINQGWPLNRTLDAQHHMDIPMSNYANCPGDGNYTGDWSVSNSTVDGVMDIYRGAQKSVNTFFAQLEEYTGVCKPYSLAKDMGIFLTDPGAERYPSFTLGVVNVSPLEMAGAYATFAARGKFCEPHPVTKILDSNGHNLKTYDNKCTQVMPQATADAVNNILRGVQEPGGFGYDLGHTGLSTPSGTTIPSAGKTGTTQDGKSVWFMGYTPQIATAAMIAGANQEGSPIPLGGISVAGSYHDPSGSGFAGPMWAAAMDPIQKYLDPEPFHPIDPETVKGVTVPLPAVGGLSVSEATKKLKAAGFKPVVGGGIYSGYSYGSVAGTSPYGSAPSGSPVTILTSIGPAPAPPPAKHHPKGGGNKPKPHKPPPHWPPHGHH